ncbi:glycosyltransferase [Salinispira pacifica]
MQRTGHTAPSRGLTFLSAGSLGDVVPLAVVAARAVEAGVRVRFLVPRRYLFVAERLRLDAVPFEHDPTSLLLEQEGPPALTPAGGLLRSVAASLRYLRRARPELRAMLDEFARLVAGSDAIAVTLPTIWALPIAHRLGIPAAALFLQPLTPTGEFPAPFQPLASLGAPTLNRTSFRLLHAALWLPWRSTVNSWRRESLELGLAGQRELFGRSLLGGAPILYGISEAIVPRPPDWPRTHRLTGFWSAQPADGSSAAVTTPPELDREIVSFLESPGAPVVSVGFGSVNRSFGALLVERAAASLERAGFRVVAFDPDGPPVRVVSSRLLRLRAAPHELLFPRLACAVHHGGAGTVAAALRAGLPQIVVPTGSDQYFWAARVQMAGCGRSIRVRRLERVGNAAREITSDMDVRARCRSLSRRLASEDGAGRAAAIIASWLEGGAGVR